MGSNPIQWGPRAQQYLQNIARNTDEGPLQYAQDNNQPAEVRSIVQRAKPSEPPPPEPHDGVTLSDEARTQMK